MVNAPPSRHPSDEALALFGERKLNDDEAVKVCQHLAGCADCSETVQMVEEMIKQMRQAERKKYSILNEAVLRFFEVGEHAAKPDDSDEIEEKLHHLKETGLVLHIS